MRKELKFDIDNINLGDLEDVAEVKRDVDISEHLPQEVIGKGLEFQAIKNVENIELTKLWTNANRLMKNMFIHLADEIGIKAYERLLGLDHKGDLIERRKRIYILWNRKVIWTHRTLLEWLDGYCGRENYDVNIIYDEYIFEFKIFMRNKTEIDYEWLNGQLRKIIPANLLIRWRFVVDQPIYYGIGSLIVREKTKFFYTPDDIDSQVELAYGIANYSTRKTRSYAMPTILSRHDGFVSGVYTDTEIEWRDWNGEN